MKRSLQTPYYQVLAGLPLVYLGLMYILHVLAQFLLKNIGLLQAYGTPYCLAVLKKDERRHRAYIVLGGKRAVLVDIDFQNTCTVAYA